MSAFVIGETTSITLQCSKLEFDSSVANSLNKKTYLQAVSQKHQTVLVTLELPHFIEIAFIQASIVGYSSRFKKQSSVKCAAHCLIFVLNCSGTVL